MSLTDLIWLATAFYAIHVAEEFMLNWRDWARAVIGLPVEWSDFYIVNSIVVVLGIVAANLSVTWPAVALAYPGLMLINAVFFHILPVIRTGGRYSPGVATAVVLFLPLGIAAYWTALANGSVGVGGGIASLAIGAALMALPIVLLNIKDRPYFRQDR